MSILSYVKSHAVVSSVIVVVVVAAAVIASRKGAQNAPAADTSSVPAVSVVNAATFRTGSLSVSANGVIQSHSQADLKSQTSAPIASIDVSIGDTVSAGQVILELQNADIRAQLAQAEASLALAQGQYSTGAVSLDSAKQAAIDKLRDAYSKTYDAVVAQAEPLLYNIDGSGRQLASFSFDNALNYEMTSSDSDVKAALPSLKASIDALNAATSTDQIESVIHSAQGYMAEATLLLNDMARIIDNLTATAASSASINSWKATVSGAQSSISAATQALTTAESGLNTSNTSQGSTAQAQIAVAQAGVNNLEAQLAKTVIRSPIAGKISALPLREGEFASPGTLVATVIGNESGLEVKAYVSGEDLSRIRVGAPVILRDQSQTGNTASTSVSIQGIVSNVSPSVDATTKKAEVDIDVSDSSRSGLVIGQNVMVSILPPAGASQSSASQGQPVSYLLPIQDVKIVPGSAYVFTVDSDSKIKQNDVIIGAIQGDFVQVTGGLTDDMDIVTPVYELDPGEQVKVQ